MGYREKYFKAYPGFNGLYRCNHCGRFFPKDQIDIDHIIPKNRGGTDALCNLQPLCQHCNRSKQDDTSKTGVNLVQSLGRDLINGKVPSTDEVATLAIKSILGHLK